MKEIGKLFKEKREKIGITLEEAANDLNIDFVLIDNFEDGNDKAFKDILEVKNIISVYSKYLDLDAKSVLEMYEDYLFSKTSKISVNDIKEKMQQVKKEEEAKKIKSPYTLGEGYVSKTKNGITIFIVVILVLIVIYYVLYKLIIG